MIIYNITIQVNKEIHDEWLQWQIDMHIPEIMATGCFLKYQMLILLEVDDTEGPTYALQFYANNRADYDRYIEQFAPFLRKSATQKWGNQFTAFRTLLQVVH